MGRRGRESWVGERHHREYPEKGRVAPPEEARGSQGHEQKTVQSLKIVELDVENNVLYIKGAVPGFNGSDLKIKPALKKS